ncbi:hypothetical protein OHT61_31750 [Streptomyces sp. NBC_00178]|uniref:hypothetical protein n=1 Tax=Streptomyces sp. NBC_00178 TaxID=2975672 RepID=UPI002E294A3B|nr:hypothetical protein [Streptomyces sp. NBC_00178]
MTLATALCVAGCTEEQTAPSKQRSASSSAEPTATESQDGAQHLKGESVTAAPKQVNDGAVLLSVASMRGNAQLPLTRKIGAGLLAVQVNCQGKGTLEVAVEPVGISFPLKCTDSEVSSIYNEIRLKRARAEGSIQVTAPSGVHWALTAEQ